MKTLVILRIAADSSIQARIEQGGVALGSQQFVLNPFDEAALAAATALKEGGQTNEVLAIVIGSPTLCKNLLPKVFAQGAARVIHIYDNEERPWEAIEQARQIRPILLQEIPDLVLIGREVLGDDSGDTAAMLAAMLDWSLATDALALRLSDAKIHVTRDAAWGSEELALTLPAIVSAELALATPRYVTLMAIAAARKRQAEPSPAQPGLNMYLSYSPLREIAPRKPGVILTSVKELASKIRLEIGIHS